MDAPEGGTIMLTLRKLDFDTELTPLERAIRLGGYAFAQAASSIADSAGPLVPIGYLERNAGRRNAERVMLRFAHPSPEQIDLALSASEGRSVLMAKLPEYDSSVLVFGRYIRRPVAPKKSDAMIIEINDLLLEAPFKVIQYYQPFDAGGFKLLSSPIFLQDDRAVDPYREAELAAFFLDGTKSDRVVEKAWSSWRD
jgi:hypothetical protein